MIPEVSCQFCDIFVVIQIMMVTFHHFISKGNTCVSSTILFPFSTL